VDTSVLDERVKKLLQDRTHLIQLKDTQKREKELLQKVAQLEEENRRLTAKNQSTQKLKMEFQQASQGLTAVDWVNKALSLWDGEKITDPLKAIEYWNNAINLKPDDATYYYNKGLAYRALDNHARAIECYNEFFRLKPVWDASEVDVAAAIYTSRGLSYSMMRQYDRAISDFNEAIRRKPDIIETYAFRATTYSTLGQYDRAIRDYSEVIRRKPDLAMAYEERGDAYNSNSQKKQAIEDYKEAIRLDQNNANIYVKRATLYFELRQLDQAIQDCNVAIRLKPDYAEAYAVRGYAYGLSFSFDGLSGNLKESCASLKRACALGTACEALFQSKKKGLCR
jgi:tetratricopeptide (TPR) repeat protein